jgi:hypothetical protein
MLKPSVRVVLAHQAAFAPEAAPSAVNVVRGELVPFREHESEVSGSPI